MFDDIRRTGRFLSYLLGDRSHLAGRLIQKMVASIQWLCSAVCATESVVKREKA